MLSAKPAKLSPLLIIITVLAVGLGYYLQQQFPLLSDEHFLANNLGLVLLINLNILVILVLGFLVSKNIIKLVLDRRRKILGSRLRARLVAAFVGLSFVPTLLLFITAKGILEHVMEGWFSPQVSASVDGAIEVAKHYYEYLEESVSLRTERLVSDTTRLLEEKKVGQTEIQNFLDSKRLELGLSEIRLVSNRGRIISMSIARPDIILPDIDFGILRSAGKGTMVVQPQGSPSGEFMRAYAALSEADPKHIIISSQHVESDLSAELDSIIGAYDDYRELYRYRRPLASIFLLMLVIVLLLILFAAVWVGFYLARGLSVPIQDLAFGTEQVAHGNLDFRIPEVADDELGVLVHSFNTMTEDLKRTTGELVGRRRYIETLLANIGVGVISLDRERRMATCNVSAAEILNLKRSSELIGKGIREALPDTVAGKLSEMLDKLARQGSARLHSSPFLFNSAGQSKSLQISVTKLEDDEANGVVILIDDLTELASAQRMAAWREVARRIAHEIKNPLTPIQLSAQRVQRKVAANGFVGATEEERILLKDTSETIINQVAIMRTLVNEFSRFARMPKLHLQLINLNELISELVVMYRDTYSDVKINTNLAEDLPELAIDKEQMTRVLGNLVDNAVASIGDTESAGVVEIETSFEQEHGIVRLVVADNGVGVSDIDKAKLFEPYYTTKQGGTGLGLSIVSSIISDHQGFIRVRDRKPKGVRFVIELPQ